MKNFIKVALTVAFLSFGGWALTVPPVVSQEKKIIEQDDQNTAGQKLYIKNCARCHSADGKSESELGKSLDAPDLTSRKVQKMSRKKIAKVVTKGEDEMPAFGKKLSADEIKTIAEYVRSF